MSPVKKANSDNKPHFGAFITMMCGLLLFFGLVSRIGKDNSVNDILSAPVVRDAIGSRDSDNGEGKRVSVVFGGENIGEGYNGLPNEDESLLEDTLAKPALERKQTPDHSAPPVIRKQKQERQKRMYVVRNGDTYYSIARKFYGSGDLYDKIKSANGFSDDSLPVGTTIVIPYLDDSRPAMIPVEGNLEIR